MRACGLGLLTVCRDRPAFSPESAGWSTTRGGDADLARFLTYTSNFKAALDFVASEVSFSTRDMRATANMSNSGTTPANVAPIGLSPE